MSPRRYGRTGPPVWWPWGWPRWRRPWQRPDDPVDRAERDRRLAHFAHLVRIGMDALGRSDLVQDGMRRIERSLDRARDDRRTLATALPEDAPDADVDRWCAALLREIIRNHNFAHRPDHVPDDVEAGLHTLHLWLRGHTPRHRPPDTHHHTDRDDTDRDDTDA